MTLTPVQVLDAARAAIPLLPSTAELNASSWEPGDPLPAADSPAVIATLSAESSLQVMLAVSDAIAEALEGAEGMTPVQALVPALEAAAATLATGVLEGTTQTNAAEQLAAGDWTSATLEAEGTVEGWVAVREVAATPETEESPVDTPAATTPPVSQATATPEQRAESMKLLYDVEMTLTAEIGRTKLAVHDVLDLAPGAVIELDRSAGSAADVMVNGRLIAHGEIVVVDEEYGIRITEIVSLAEQQNMQ